MNLLAFDTSTDVMSMAVSRRVDGVPRVWQHDGPGGALASSGLIQGLMDLLQEADLSLKNLDAICFGSGPGSFTGLRTACSVAQGLAFGAGVPVLPIPSLLAVAEEARYTALPHHPTGQVIALLDARMDEMYGAIYAFEGERWNDIQAPCLLSPAGLQKWESAHARRSDAWAGNVFAVFADRLPAQLGGQAPYVKALPTAAAMLRLAPGLMAADLSVAAHQAMPIYIRDKVAKTTEERAVEKAQKAEKNHLAANDPYHA
jgi:tRNA threonylcarbamoyladenosine biosynthesis protein TsaB